MFQSGEHNGNKNRAKKQRKTKKQNCSTGSQMDTEYYRQLCLVTEDDNPNSDETFVTNETIFKQSG